MLQSVLVVGPLALPQLPCLLLSLLPLVVVAAALSLPVLQELQVHALVVLLTQDHFVLHLLAGKRLALFLELRLQPHIQVVLQNAQTLTSNRLNSIEPASIEWRFDSFQVFGQEAD